MKIIKSALQCFALCSMTLFVLQCGDSGPQDMAGGVVENGNAFISGYLYNKDGTPAANASVKLISYFNNPQAGNHIEAFAVTDENGRYGFDTVTAGIYNIFGEGQTGDVSYSESLYVAAKQSTFPQDTLNDPGTLKGVVQLNPFRSNGIIFIVLMGTNVFTTPVDSVGNFMVSDLAEGNYRLKIVTTLADYTEKDTMITIGAGQTTDIDTLYLDYMGISQITGVSSIYDTLSQTAIISWNAADTAIVSGYNVYRGAVGLTFVDIPINISPVTDTFYCDSHVTVGNYIYRIKAISKNGDVGGTYSSPDTVIAVSDSFVTTVAAIQIHNAVGDTISIFDSAMVVLTYENPTREIHAIRWYADSESVPLKESVLSGSNGIDTLKYFCNSLGEVVIHAVITDAGGALCNNAAVFTVILDKPAVVISGKQSIPLDSSVTYSAAVSQKFGTIVKYRWDNGIAPGFDDSTGATYSVMYSNQGIYSLILEVLDDDGNSGRDTFMVYAGTGPAFHLFWYRADSSQYDISAYPGPDLAPGLIIETHPEKLLTTFVDIGYGYSGKGFLLGKGVDLDRAANTAFFPTGLHNYTGIVSRAIYRAEYRDGGQGNNLCNGGPIYVKAAVADVSFGIMMWGSGDALPEDATWADMDPMNTLDYDLNVPEGSISYDTISAPQGRTDTLSSSLLDKQFFEIDVTHQVNWILSNQTDQTYYAIVLLVPTSSVSGMTGLIAGYASPLNIHDNGGSDNPWTTDGNTGHLVIEGTLEPRQ